VLALMFLLGIPARRRKWISMLTLLAVITVLGGLVACGSSSSKTTTGTTAGTYKFTVTGSGNDASSTTAKTTFTVTVE
jgi:major membrane immunogen (membrane-anchored lipoprotein)